MEDSSMNYSSINEEALDASKRTIDDSPEESGWTSYFEELSCFREQSLSSSSFATSSMVSDAASFPAWKSSYKQHVGAGSSVGKTPRKLTFKKSRAREISYDDSLEDTASSPVNSPKVSDLTPIDMHHRKTTDQYFNSSLGKGGNLEHYGGLAETDGRCEMSTLNGKSDYTDLKKRGLCLVPLSMLVNYLG
ncbi:hypothetical protein Tsubulata_029920 [Turnera subulata]|uniref:Uncharacterized protein n=1 Tax=Turnera subulata TaxID=218843 RepID=A0A9Q0FTD9_9ROSI|nr:hypothetical protein Tsubulata_029920 [Turnera subulata]